ncbi:MAG: hypothetical protein JSW11_18230 [Candidatus Heimdallarchaeota archaeon]|nr:MAG: hypothetical protein JSW11_18230 [Candidatus Heimdallarchaeota archaeon]
MSERFWVIAAWKHTSIKGKIMITVGFLSLLSILIGVLVIFIGIIGLFTIVGAAHPNTNKVLNLLFSSFIFLIIGTVGMIIYLIGMRFIPPPMLPETPDQ